MYIRQNMKDGVMVSEGVGSGSDGLHSRLRQERR